MNTHPSLRAVWPSESSFIYAFAASLGVNLILAGGIVAMEDKSRVVVLPAEPSKSF